MDFEAARKKRRYSIEKLAEESGFKVNFVRKLKKGKYPITKAIKRIMDPILNCDLEVESKCCEELLLLEKHINTQFDCTVDHCENLVIATVFEDGLRVNTILRMNQLHLDNPLAIRNEASGFIFELNNQLKKARVI